MLLSLALVSICSYWDFAVDFFVQYSSSTSDYANKHANRYVVLSYCAIFRSCLFLGLLVFYSTLFFGGLQPSNYN